MDTATRVQILDEADCISHCTNTLGKGMDPIILPPAMSKRLGRLRSSALVWQLVWEKENSEFQPVKLRLKIDLVSYPAIAEGVGKYGNVMIILHFAELEPRQLLLFSYKLETFSFGDKFFHNKRCCWYVLKPADQFSLLFWK